MSCRWIALWVMLTPFVVQADTLPPAKINPQITRMQAQIDALTKRIERLEQRLPAHTPSPDASSHPLTTPPRTPPQLTALEELEKIRENWQQLHHGLSKTELRHLLGNPASKFKLNRQTIWYYRYPGIGSGSVILGYSGKVNGWQEPPFR